MSSTAGGGEADRYPQALPWGVRLEARWVVSPPLLAARPPPAVSLPPYSSRLLNGYLSNRPITSPTKFVGAGYIRGVHSSELATWGLRHYQGRQRPLSFPFVGRHSGPWFGPAAIEHPWSGGGPDGRPDHPDLPRIPKCPSLPSGSWTAAPSRLFPFNLALGWRRRPRPPSGLIALSQLLTAKLSPGGNPGGRVIRSRVKAFSSPEAFPGRHARQRVRIAMLLPRSVFNRVLEIGQPLHPSSLLVPGVLPPQQPT